MIRFSPEFTEVLVFDLEANVPKEDRRRSCGPSLAVNPFKKDHLLLGGVVYCEKPLARKVISDYVHHWVWDLGDEAKVTASLYAEFRSVWERVKHKQSRYSDPVVAGVGISVFDLPFLTCKCFEHEVAEPEEIYETMCKFRVLDLSAAGLGFVRQQRPVLYPCTHNELANELLGDRCQKPTGKCVWDMFDEGNFSAIEKRCEDEVSEMVLLMSEMLEREKVGVLDSVE